MVPLNPFDRRARPDPYPLYQFMRTVEPVHRSPAGFWILTRYDDCRAVLEDPRWSHDADRILEPARGKLQPVDPTVRLLRASLAFQDPPDHAKHRRPLEAVVKATLKSAAPRVAKVANGLIALMREKETGVDLMRDYATPLPLVVLSDMLGFPAADRSDLQRWSRELVAGVDPLVRGQGVINAGAAAAAMTEYLIGRLDVARAGAGTGMLGELAAKPSRLSTWEVIADITAFLVIGVEACSGLIGNAMLALLRNPAQMQALKDNPSLIDEGVEELIRFDCPIHLTARATGEDVEVGGTRIGAGEQVIVLLAAANRDPARFADPDRLDLARADNMHLGFGAGTHACFAAPLARIIGRAAISALLANIEGLEPAGEPAWNDTVTMRGLSRLPVSVAR